MRRLARRTFLGCGAVSVLRGSVANTVSLGVIGAGWQGFATMKIFQNDPRVRIAGICDIDANHLAAAKQAAPDARAHHEFEELIARRDIDAVYIAAPDHWHGVMATAAIRAGKDVYGEKPLAHNWAEGKAIADAVERYGRIWQTGSWQRSQAPFQLACDLVRSGRIGKVTRVEVGLPAGHNDWDNTASQTKPEPPPKTLDYARWLGPAPDAPYSPARVHKTWRWNLDYGGGSLMDWVGHHVDIAHWGLGLDHTGPSEVEGTGEFDRAHPVWNAPARFRITARYVGGLTMLITGGHDDIRPGTRWIGDEGWIWVDRSGLESHPRHIVPARLPATRTHHVEFIDSVLTRQQTSTPAHVALRSATPGWLGLIAILTGRKLRWDPQQQRILNDSTAARLLARPMKAPWHL